MKKFEKDFKEWLDAKRYSTYPLRNDINWIDIIIHTGQNSFDLLSWDMKWGVYLAFFDSVGICISIESFDDGFEAWVYLKNGVNNLKDYGFKTREQTQKKAVEKAIEIYNGL